jgi:hypothetical protein
MNKIDAVEAAAAYIEAKGFEFAARSNLSEARYFRRPGYTSTLRVAAHECRHRDQIAANLTIDYKEAWERDEQRVAWISNLAALHRACDDLIDEYDFNAEEDDE